MKIVDRYIIICMLFIMFNIFCFKIIKNLQKLELTTRFLNSLGNNIICYLMCIPRLITNVSLDFFTEIPALELNKLNTYKKTLYNLIPSMHTFL